jgi:hypothetical protein
LGDGTRKCAPLMAKQLTLEEVEGNGGTVQLDQRVAAPPASIMNRVSDEFLASPGFSLDEYRGIHGRNTLGLLQDEFQSCAIAYDLLESAGPTVLICDCHRTLNPKAQAHS